MTLNILKNYQTLVIILMPLILGALWLNSFIHPVMIPSIFEERAMPLYKLVLNMAGNHVYLRESMALFFFVIQVLLIIKLNKDFILIDFRTYLPAVIFILTGCSFPFLQQLHPVVMANIFILLALGKIMESYREDKLFTNFFDASVLVSIASLCYFNSMFFVLIVWSGLVILRQFSIREWLLTIAGLIIPYLFVLAYYYIYDQIPHFISMIVSNFEYSRSFKMFSLPSLIFYSYLSFLVLLASFGMIRRYDKMKIGIRKYYKLFFWLFIYSVAVFAAAPGASAEVLLISAIPVSFVLSNYLAGMKKERTGNIFLFILLILIFYMQIGK